jgi:hypothetical protein
MSPNGVTMQVKPLAERIDTRAGRSQGFNPRAFGMQTDGAPRQGNLRSICANMCRAHLR